MQVRSELLEFASLIQDQRPKAFLEIGTRNGGTFFVLCRLADPQAIVISLDLPGGRFGGGYTFFQIPVMRRMKKARQKLHLFRADSHSIETQIRVTRALQGVQLDLLFIDGDHTYHGVRRDFQMYSPLVKPGGIVAFHDIVQVPDAGVEVARFWNEIKPGYRHREIIEDRQQGWGGIGVLYL
jgi:predicted O-methyltransferase YrrM